MPVEFQKGDSTLHRLDARTKLLMFVGLTIIAITIIDPIIIAALFLTLYWFGTRAVDPRLLNRNLRVLVVIFFTFSLFQIFFFSPEDAVFLFYLVPGKEWIPVTVQGLVRSVAVFFRFFIVVLSVHLMLYTTPPVDLVLGLTRRERQQGILRASAIVLFISFILFLIALLTLDENSLRLSVGPGTRAGLLALASVLVGVVIHWLASRGLPPEMSIALSIGFATVGILSQQAQKITDAQKARGFNTRPKSLIRRIQVLTGLLIPIFLATLERSQDIAIAILARALDYNIAHRTYRRQLTFSRLDYLAMALIIGCILGSLFLNRSGIGNPTEQMILSWIGY